MKRYIIVAIATAFAGSAAAAQSDGPTCSAELGIANHGQHIVGDYVTGLGAVIFGDDLNWPPNGQVGETVADNGGAYVPGGPGPGWHFDNGVAPGASFCTDSSSKGVHL